MASGRSTKKQKELLDYVAKFIREYGYGPSYREIMDALGYRSVSTVAVHVNGLVAKGYLRKSDNSPRSLEVVNAEYVPGDSGGAGVSSASGAGERYGVKGATLAREKWLVDVVNDKFREYEGSSEPRVLDEIYVLVGALKVLGFEEAYAAMRNKLVKPSR